MKKEFGIIYEFNTKQEADLYFEKSYIKRNIFYKIQETNKLYFIDDNTNIEIPLNSSGAIPTALSQLSEDVSHRVVTDTEKATWNALIGGSIFQSVWNATTNTPALTSSVGTKGYYYIVSVAGSTNLDSITDWKIGDWAIFDGTVWRKVDKIGRASCRERV